MAQAIDENSKLGQLLQLAQGQSGGPPPADLHLGDAASSGPRAELRALLNACNGFTLFYGGVQIFYAGDAAEQPERGPELLTWNKQPTWKDTYGSSLAGQDLLCFGQDLFGVQFAVTGDDAVVTIDPETCDTEVIGSSLEEWAAWLLEDEDSNGAAGFAEAYQSDHGTLAPTERLVPVQLFVMGGSYDFDNIVVKHAAEAMRIRGPIAQQIAELPDGAKVTLGTG